MKSRIFLFVSVWSIMTFSQNQEKNDTTTIELQSAEIILRLPVTSEKITKSELQEKNLGQDLPTLLQNVTSVTTTSDAGGGIGYSSIRVRGIRQEDINITMNGVTLNDPESHGVFWVNMPDLASGSSSVLIQRGVGTSSSGTGAFGAVLNIDSSNPSPKAFLESSNSWGSFATQKYSLQGGTGSILNNKFQMDLNTSIIKSDGYIDRASSDLFSYGLNARYKLNQNTSFRYWTFFGKEKTYQAWNGIDAETMKENRRFNSAGAIYNDDWSEVIDYYDNETDNYQQHHNHLIWDQNYGRSWRSNTTLYYTRGKGYYENYKQGAKLIEYKINSPVEYSDLVRQKWLDNHFYGVNFNLENQKLGNWKFFTGFSASQYKNQHYGKVVWAKDLEISDGSIEFYRNKSEKTDLSVYTKALFQVNQIEFFADLQYRFVNFKTRNVTGGENAYEDFFPFKDNFNFINPKFGFSYFTNSNQQLYFYYGMAHREPSRSDFIDNPVLPRPEKLHDFELGYKKGGRWRFNSNLFFMYYLDQLVATGELNDVGGYIRSNSGKSYRSGAEISTEYELLPQKLTFMGNLTFSINQNQDYKEIAYDDNGAEYIKSYGNTAISFSPNWIGMFGIQYQPVKSLFINLSNKYVGEQFMTNTELEDGRLDSYFLTDVLVKFSPNWWNLKNLEFSLLINNLFDQEYESNGYYYEGPYYYPQAGINILGGFSIRL